MTVRAAQVLNLHSIPVGGGKSIRLRKPPRLGIDNENRLFVLPEWELSIPMDGNTFSSLRRKIGLRFLDLFHRGQAGDLSESEARLLAQITSLIDVGEYVQTLRRPIYREGVWRKHGKHYEIEFLASEPVRVPRTTIRSLSPIGEDVWFGAEFELDREGSIIGVLSPRPVYDPRESSEGSG